MEINNEPIIVYLKTHDKITFEFSDCHSIEDHENYSAFTASELLELLPYRINEDDYINISKHAEYFIYYWKYDFNLDKYFEDDNLSNAIAKMLINLIENNLLDIK